VFFVTPDDHRYLSARDEREEGGSPDGVGAIRAALALRLAALLPAGAIEVNKSYRGTSLIRKDPTVGLAFDERLTFDERFVWPQAAESAIAQRVHAALSAHPRVALLGPALSTSEVRCREKRAPPERF